MGKWSEFDAQRGLHLLPNPDGSYSSPVLFSGVPQTVAGDTTATLLDPPAGSGVRLRWIQLQAKSTNTSAVTVTVTLTTAVYVAELKVGVVPIFQHATHRVGAVNDNLTVTVTGPGDVLVNFDAEVYSAT